MRSKLTLVFVGVGSNLQKPQAQVVSAIAAIASAKEMVLEGRSPLYSSPPMGPPDQPNYVNAVVKLNTRLNSFDSCPSRSLCLEFMDRARAHGICVCHDAAVEPRGKEDALTN